MGSLAFLLRCLCSWLMVSKPMITKLHGAIELVKYLDLHSQRLKILKHKSS